MLTLSYYTQPFWSCNFLWSLCTKSTYPVLLYTPLIFSFFTGSAVSPIMSAISFSSYHFTFSPTNNPTFSLYMYHLPGSFTMAPPLSLCFISLALPTQPLPLSVSFFWLIPLFPIPTPFHFPYSPPATLNSFV